MKVRGVGTCSPDGLATSVVKVRRNEKLNTVESALKSHYDLVNVNRTEDFQPRSQPRQGLHVYRYGHPGLRPAEFVKPAGNAASQMRPDVLSGRGVSINMQPLRGWQQTLGLATSVVKVRRNEKLNTVESALKSHFLTTSQEACGILISSCTDPGLRTSLRLDQSLSIASF